MAQNPSGISRWLGRVRAAVLVAWAAAICFFVGAYITSPEKFAPQTIAARLQEFEAAVIFVYLALSILRGLALLPSTPLVIAGVLLFPNRPWLVLAVSLFGIVASSSMIYWISDVLGIARYFEHRTPEHVAKIRYRLEHPAGLLFVVMWAFFPFVPTDAVCYVAGSIRMGFIRFIVAVFVGELILCSIYVFSGDYIVNSLTQ